MTATKPDKGRAQESWLKAGGAKRALILASALLFALGASAIWENLAAAEAEATASGDGGRLATRVPAEAWESLAFIASKGGVASPLPSSMPVTGGDCYISGYFGWRDNPLTGEGKEFHAGLDIAGKRGTLIIAPAGGTVVESYSDPNSGETVKIDHPGGISTLYAHLDRRWVSVGERVERGGPIGRMGWSGRSTGSHLHYAVIKDGQPLDPLPFVWGGMTGELARIGGHL